MIVPDLNILLFAYNVDSPLHDRAKNWWTSVIETEEPIGIPWVVVLGFIRLTTSGQLFRPPLSVHEATNTVSEWLGNSNVFIVEPNPETHLTTVLQLLALAGKAGNLVTDAHIAAIALENRATVHTHDNDFADFPGLKLHFPLKNA